MQRKESRNVATILEGMTWLPRIIHLFPSVGGTCEYSGKASKILVREIIFRSGYKFAGKDWQDPNVAYTKKLPVKPFLGAWRDVGHLMVGDAAVVRKKVRCITPRVTRNIDGIISVDAYGLSTKKDKCLYWKVETMHLPKMNVDKLNRVISDANLIDAGIYAQIANDHKSYNGVLSNIRAAFWRVVQDFVTAGKEFPLDKMTGKCCDIIRRNLAARERESSILKLEKYIEQAKTDV